MESVVNLIFSVENIRMLVMLAFGTCGFVWIKNSFNVRIDGVENSLNKRIDGVEVSLLKAMDEKIANSRDSLYNQLKATDFRHLNDTIEALTFTLEKNGFLKREDKEYISGRLDK